MKIFFESFKDILYDFMDYIIMILIILAVIGVIGWRLDILFAKDITNPISQELADKEKTPSLEISDDLPKEVSSQESDTLASQSTKDNEIEDPKKESPDDINDKSIKINIPNGSLPSKIGNILEDNGLIESKNDFVEKAQSMNLDRSLKSGNYEISINSSLEDIVNIISRQR